MLVSRYAPVSAFTVFVGVVGGIAAFGAIGIVIGPVFLALVAAILDYFDENVIAPNTRIEAQADEPPAGGFVTTLSRLRNARGPVCGADLFRLRFAALNPYHSRPDERLPDP